MKGDHMKYFGTDGFRGKANEVLTADHAFNIGKFLGWYFTDGAHKKASCVIGKDTRRSSYMFEYALAAGLSSGGVDCLLYTSLERKKIRFRLN